MDNYEKDVNVESYNNNDRDEIFSKAVRAGKRTYFFDVKATRKNDLFLTITESKKMLNSNGQSFFEKHKVFLYKEDLDKFSNGLAEAVEFLKEKLGGDIEQDDNNYSKEDKDVKPFTIGIEEFDS